MVDQNIVDRELCLEAMRRGLVTKETLIPFAQRKRAEPSRSLTGLLIEGGVLTPELGSELERIARSRAASMPGEASGNKGSGKIAPIAPPAAPSTSRPDLSKGKNVGTTSGKQSRDPGTSSSQRIKLDLPQNTILEIDAAANAPPAPPPPPAPARKTAALKPGDSKAPGVSPEQFRASRTYVDTTMEVPDGGRTMLEDNFDAPPDGSGDIQRTMMAQDDFQSDVGKPAEVHRTLIAEDDFEAPPVAGGRTFVADDGFEGDALDNTGVSAVKVPPAPPIDAPVPLVSRAPGSSTPKGPGGTSTRGGSGSSHEAPAGGRVVAPGAPRTQTRRGPRDMEAPRVVIGGYFGDYEILASLGEGAMGQVFRAKRRTDGLIVALKVMRGGLVSNPKVRERFLREAKAAKMIDHVNVVHFIDAGMIGNDQYLAMEFVEGRSLQQVLTERKGQPLEFERAADLFRQICSGLAAAHEAGVIHRDLKPENILLTRDGEIAKITDFGLARREEESMLLTRPGQVMGSPYYMAPEQGMGLPVDHRADIYSLGNILFCLFTGRVPFPFPSATEVIHAHCQAERPDPRDVNPDVGPELAAFMIKMLAKEADGRPQTAKDALGEFEDVYERELAPSLVPSQSQLPEMLDSQSRESDEDEIFTGSAAPRVVGALAPGTRVGPLKVVSVIGAGGMGAVYRAQHDTGRQSALKLMSHEIAADPKRAEAFMREATLGAKVHAPNVVETRDFGDDPEAGYAYIELELVEGTSLEHLIKTGVRQDETLLINIARGMAQALDAIHAQGVLHRDVKPANILLGPGFLNQKDAAVKLIDFGLAIETKDVLPSGKSQFAGTPAYMAPEQTSNDGVADERSDLYALGCTLYHAACAVPPFEGKTPAAVAYQHQRTRPKDPRTHNASLSPAFEVFIQLMLSKNPDERFQSAKELLAELSRTTEDGKLAKPQVHAKYRTNRLGKGNEVMHGDLDPEANAPPRRGIIMFAAIGLIACLVPLIVALVRTIFVSSVTVHGGPSPTPSGVQTGAGQGTPTPADTPTGPQPTPSPIAMPSTLAPKTIEGREKTVAAIKKFMDDGDYINARKVYDEALKRDPDIRPRFEKKDALFQNQLDTEERMFRESLEAARRASTKRDFKEARKQLNEAEGEMSRDSDKADLQGARTEVDEREKKLGGQ